MKNAIAVLGLAALLGCSSNPPPTPPPPPPPPPIPSLLLRQPNPPHLTRDDQPFTPFGAIQCCAACEGCGASCNTLWPLASECWMDYTHARGANMYHFRMGPFYGDHDHEGEWALIGGPYAGGPGSDWNPAFWDRYRELLAHARKIGANVEVVVIDTWVCKHAQWGGLTMPWPTEDVEACGRRPSPGQERYIRKVVSEAKDAPHVVWITDNEGGEIQGTRREWYEWVASIVRDEEQKSGGATRLIGTNNTDFCVSAAFDYCATHDRSPLTAPLAGKHTENNERNPSLATPEQEHAAFCGAQAKGLHWWLWRDDMSNDDFERMLTLFGQGCTPSPTTFPVRFPLPGAVIYMRNHRYGNGVDSTPRVSGDPELCEAIHGVVVNDCHFDNDKGLWQPSEQRADYEGWVLAGARAGQPLPAAPLGPVWEYKAGGQQGQCHDDRVHPNTSCDHFGSSASGWRDDPHTPEFEGRPAWLAAQSDEFGPYAGWFMVPQTSGPTFGTLVRACLPGRLGDDSTCASWVSVDWR